MSANLRLAQPRQPEEVLCDNAATDVTINEPSNRPLTKNYVCSEFVR